MGVRRGNFGRLDVLDHAHDKINLSAPEIPLVPGMRAGKRQVGFLNFRTRRG